MPKISDVYAGNFVVATELSTDRRIVAIIRSSAVEVVGADQQPKLALDLQAADGRLWPRRMLLNKSNAMLLAAAFGDDTDHWRGQRIECWQQPVMFQGRAVAGIKVMPAAPAGNGAGMSPGAAPAPEAPAASALAQPRSALPGGTASLATELDDDIPF